MCQYSQNSFLKSQIYTLQKYCVIVHHCVKSVRIWSLSSSYFPASGLNIKRYQVFLRIQSECWKYGPEKLRIRTIFAQCILNDLKLLNGWIDLKCLLTKNSRVKKMEFWRCWESNNSYQIREFAKINTFEMS